MLLSPALAGAFAFVFGLVVGSFLNVVIHRVPLRLSLVRPGSRCPSCERPVRWHENVPLLSYVLLRGRCRGCRSPISPRYPVVELVTAMMFLASSIAFGWEPVLVLRHWPFIALLIAVTFIDLDHRIIPDRISLPGMILGVATSWLDPRLSPIESALGAGVGFAIFFLFAEGYRRLRGRSGLGGGDVKLLAMIGAFTGVSGVFWTILVSSVFGSVVGIGYALLARKRSVLNVALPYGPFLAIGALVFLFFGPILVSYRG